jgi:hypothetical protein
MPNLTLVTRRLLNQHFTSVPFGEPVEVVRWFGAVQAQEFYSAKWALALRMDGAKDTGLDTAFATGAILRTHVMRPTWHFVAAEDIRWMQELTAERVHIANAPQYRRAGLDAPVCAQSNAVIAKALQGGKQLIRTEVEDRLYQAGLFPDRGNRLRFIYLLMYAELSGVICSGALRGKQHTYALLEERAPQAKALARDEALATLALRYFTSHGPATLKDFTTWSGLLVADATQGIEMVKSELVEMVIAGESYWFSPHTPAAREVQPSAYLLPAFDEYTVGYKDRSAILDPQYADRCGYGLNNVILLDGRIAGIWKRKLKRDTVEVTLETFRALTETEAQAVAAAAQQFGEFLDKSVEMD